MIERFKKLAKKLSKYRVLCFEAVALLLLMVLVSSCETCSLGIIDKLWVGLMLFLYMAGFAYAWFDWDENTKA